MPERDRVPFLPRSRIALRHYALVSTPVFAASRVLDRLVRPRVYLGDHTLMTRTVFGHVLYLDTRDDSLMPALVLRGVWEPKPAPTCATMSGAEGAYTRTLGKVVTCQTSSASGRRSPN